MKKIKKKNVPAAKPSLAQRPHIKNIYITLVLILTTIVFFNSLNNDFTNWDDDKYIFENEYIKDISPTGIEKIFTETYFTNYHPLTTLTYAIEYRLFGYNAKVYHTTNLILHLINTLLVFLCVLRLGKNQQIAWITALLFGIHPMHVESVAWISERKDVLFTMFFILSLMHIIKYIQNGAQKKLSLLWAFLFFTGSLMSKSAAVVLPLIMLLCYYEINKRIKIKDVLETLPFFALALVFGLITIKAQDFAIHDANTTYNVFNKIILVLYALSFYIIRFIAPFNFSALHMYPSPVNNWLPTAYYVAPLVLMALLLLYIYADKEAKQHLRFGLLFFILNLILVIQILPFGQTIVSERYTYVPYIGLAFIMAFYYTRLHKKFKIPATLVGIAFLIFLSVSTWQQNRVWANSISLWTKAIKVNPDNAIALRHRGDAWLALKKHEAAKADYNKAITLRPEYVQAYVNRGTVHSEQGFFEEAVKDYSKAIDINPNFAPAYYNRANIWQYNLSKFDKALADYNKALLLSEDYTDARNNRGILLINMGQHAEAIEDFNKIIASKPSFFMAYNNRGFAKSSMGKYQEAISDYDIVVKLQPKYALAFYNRGFAYLNLNNKNKACTDWKMALKYGYTQAQAQIDAHCNAPVD